MSNDLTLDGIKLQEYTPCVVVLLYKNGIPRKEVIKLPDVLGDVLLVKLIVNYDADTDTFFWTAYGLDQSVSPALILTTSGSESNGVSAGGNVVDSIVSEWNPGP